MCEIGNLAVFGFLIYSSVSDMRTRKIPSGILIFMSVFVFLFRVEEFGQNMIAMVSGVLIGGVFWMISAFTKEAIGYGDSWMILLLGGYLGGKEVLELITVAFFLAGGVSLAGLLLGKWKHNFSIPFIPFLTAAYIWVVLL